MGQQNLTKQQYDVLFNKATEPPFSGAWLAEYDDGLFCCVNCGQPLFASERKYDSGSGWPSFDQALAGTITTKADNSHGLSRTEVSCAKCGGHLGHLFSDGPKQTTGQRFCINSLALDFKSQPSDTSN